MLSSPEVPARISIACGMLPPPQPGTLFATNASAARGDHAVTLDGLSAPQKNGPVSKVLTLYWRPRQMVAAPKYTKAAIPI